MIMRVDCFLQLVQADRQRIFNLKEADILRVESYNSKPFCIKCSMIRNALRVSTDGMSTGKRNLTHSNKYLVTGDCLDRQVLRFFPSPSESLPPG
mmetsp:Transcript_1445/g.3600  ORF Transcript_1445/g.3600 Transcript_1445/m.3600 type:complete len:95 (-) Transcript_1445:1458-1742(-)